MLMLHRAKCRENKEWVVGFVAGVEMRHVQSGIVSYYFHAIDGNGKETLCTVDAKTVTPISSNLDISGLPICEYDIVEFECNINVYTESANGTCAVNAKPVMNRALVVFDGEHWLLSHLKYDDVAVFTHWSHMKIIGNIFDNPELLEGKAVDLKTEPFTKIIECIKDGWRGTPKSNL